MAGDGGEVAITTIELPTGGGDGEMVAAPTPKPKGKKGKRGKQGKKGMASAKPKRSKPPKKTKDPSATPKPKPTKTPKPAPAPKPAHTPKPKGASRSKGAKNYDEYCAEKGVEYKRCIQDGETFRARTGEDPSFDQPGCNVNFEDAQGGDRRRLKGSAYREAMSKFKEICKAAGMGCKTKGKRCYYNEQLH